MLYQRYGNPICLLQQMLRTGQFYDFISELISIKNEQETDKMRWECWLHKIYDMSYEDFLWTCKPPQTSGANRNDIEATVKSNFEMMENFHPELE